MSLLCSAASRESSNLNGDGLKGGYVIPRRAVMAWTWWRWAASEAESCVFDLFVKSVHNIRLMFYSKYVVCACVIML